MKKEVTINFKETCSKCNGTGAKPGTSPEKCSKCGGHRTGSFYTAADTFRNNAVSNNCVLIVMVQVK